MKTLGLVITSFLAGYQLMYVGTVAAQDDSVGTFRIRKPIDSILTFGGDSVLIGNQVFTFVDQMPEFPGGQRAFVRYLNRVEYPIQAKENNIEGTIYVGFIINEFGYVDSPYPQLTKGPGDPFLRKAAEEWISKMPQPWKPGRQNGVPVKVSYRVPIKFSLH